MFEGLDHSAELKTPSLVASFEEEIQAGDYAIR